MTNLPAAHVTKHSVSLDGKELPGLIEQESVTVKPMAGHARVNELTLTFLVGEVTVEP